MKQKINKDLFFAIISAFEHQIEHFEKCKRLSVGCAIHCTDSEERKTHLKAATDAGNWACEVYNTTKSL